MRWCARNEAGLDVPESPADLHLSASVLPTWIDQEDWGIDRFPLTDVPHERRTDVARLAAKAYSENKLPRDRFARYLEVSPVDDVERVLDYLGLDLPEPRD